AAIFDLEQEQIFERAWIAIAHTSELTRAGDYRAAEVAGQPVLAVKDENGQERVFFNTCRHKVTTLDGDRTGNSSQIKGPYHHWTYRLSGELISVPRIEAYGDTFRLEDHGLIPVPRMEVFHGIVFISLSDTGPGLLEFLGPAAEYLVESATYNGEDLVSLGAYE